MAVDFTLKIDGIEGESKIQGHVDEIDILSFGWGAKQQGSFGAGGGGGAGKVHIEEISFSKFVDKASPMLVACCTTGRHLEKATLTARKAGDKPLDYLTICFSSVLVTSYQVSASTTGDIPIDTFTLNFLKVEFKYATQNKNGTAGDEKQWAWDIGQNAPG